MRRRKEKKFNPITIYITLSSLCVVFLTVGFSALQSELSLSDISAIVRPQKDIRITSTTYHTSTNSGTISNLDYNVDNINGTINLPNSNSTVSYTVTVTNIGNTEVGFSNVLLSDSRLDYDISGYTEGTKLCDDNDNTTCKLGSVTTFTITIKYKSGASITNSDIDFIATFDFKNVYTITYMNMSNTTNYPKNILEGETLTVTFSNDVPPTIKIKRGDNTTLPAGTYTYVTSGNNKILTVPNVTSDLIIDRDYAITYILNGGTNHQDNPTSYAQSDNITLKDPTYAGNRFDGWYLNSGFTGTRIISTTQLSGTATLYAKWIPEYTITYTLYGGTNNNNNPTGYIQTDNIAIQNPIQSGYIFAGWYLNSSYTGSIITNTNQLSGNVTLHAKWVPIFNITYQLNGGTNPNNQITEFSELLNETILNPTNPHDATFDGWYQSSGLTGTRINTTSQLNSNTLLYAKWISSITNMNFDTTTNRFNSTNVSGVKTANLSNTSYRYTQNSANITINAINISMTYSLSNGSKDGYITCTITSNSPGFTTSTGEIHIPKSGTSADTTITMNTPIQPSYNYTISFNKRTGDNNGKININGISFQINP